MAGHSGQLNILHLQDGGFVKSEWLHILVPRIFVKYIGFRFAGALYVGDLCISVFFVFCYFRFGLRDSFAIVFIDDCVCSFSICV